MIDICSRSKTCANFPARCEGCRAMSDVVEHYPYYEVIHAEKPKKSKVKIFNSMYEERLEDYVNTFIEDKNVVDIQYHHCPNSHSVLIIYKED